ncbi:hypothetical protein [Pseudorhodoferax sp.]|uniref:hypothetical protein n=1 Tax=Pseudorhodoferax sp. TaxID=1993553 RepID=UPI002DD6ADFB|nr:hypothetical protein [Pseudorhodoferax sp.]
MLKALKAHFMQNDSPNPLWLDGTVWVIGFVICIALNVAVALGSVPRDLENSNWVVVVIFMASVIALAIQKIRGVKFNRYVYAIMMFCVGWGVGVFLLVEIKTRA